MRTIQLLPLCVVGIFYSSALHASDAYLFINGHLEKHRALADQVNEILLNVGDETKGIALVDIADEPTNFLGELVYIHDKDGRFLSEFMPHRIPSFVEVNNLGHIRQYSPSDYLAKSLRLSAK